MKDSSTLKVLDHWIAVIQWLHDILKNPVLGFKETVKGAKGDGQVDKVIAGLCEDRDINFLKEV